MDEGVIEEGDISKGESGAWAEVEIFVGFDVRTGSTEAERREYESGKGW